MPALTSLRSTEQYRKRNNMSWRSTGDTPALSDYSDDGSNEGPVLVEAEQPVLQQREDTASDVARDNANRIGEIMRRMGISEDYEDA